MRRTLTTLCVLALVLAACGGDDGATDPDSALEGDDSGAAVENGSGEDDTNDTETPDTQPSDDGGSAQGLPPGGSGTVTIDGETLEPEWVGNCLIDETFDPQPGDLDLTASFGGLDALFLEISNDEVTEFMGPVPFEYVRLGAELQLRTESGDYASHEQAFVTGPDGNWYAADGPETIAALGGGNEPEGGPLDTPPLVLEDGRVSGSFTLEGNGEPIEVSYDLTYKDPVDCSL